LDGTDHNIVLQTPNDEDYVKKKKKRNFKKGNSYKTGTTQKV